MDRNTNIVLNDLFDDALQKAQFDEFENEDYIIAFKGRNVECNNDDNEKFIRIRSLNNTIYWIIDEVLTCEYNSESQKKTLEYLFDKLQVKIDSIRKFSFSEEEKQKIKREFTIIYDIGNIKSWLKTEIQKDKKLGKYEGFNLNTIEIRHNDVINLYDKIKLIKSYPKITEVFVMLSQALNQIS